MHVTLLYLDESVYRDVAWLTGVLVPAERVPDLRDAVIRIAQETLVAAGHEYLAPTELHGVSMLRNVRGITDDHRLNVFERIADLVTDEEIEIVSIGHAEATRVRRNLADMHMDPGQKMYNLNFREIVDALVLPPDALVIPVFDGVPGRARTHGASNKSQAPVDHFAYEAFLGGANHTHWYRVGFERKPNGMQRYKRNLRNLAEPTFSDSAQSPLLQLADVVGYLLGVTADVAEFGATSEWKARVAVAGQRLDSKLIRRQVVTMNFVGSQDLSQQAIAGPSD
jgi:hypothetical protein